MVDFLKEVKKRLLENSKNLKEGEIK